VSGSQTKVTIQVSTCQKVRDTSEGFSIDPDEAKPEKTIFRCIATIALFVTATAHADQLTPLELDRYPEPTSVMAPAPEPPAAWFYERFQLPTHAMTLQQAAALRQLQSEMDSGYQPYVFCCGGLEMMSSAASTESRYRVRYLVSTV